MSTLNGDPYDITPGPPDMDLANPVKEFTIVAAHTMVMIDSAGTMAMADTYNGSVPGPTIRVTKDESIYVRFKNQMTHATAIHWHGVEMANHKDGSPFTQDAVEPGHSYLYKLRFPRPGLYWYHPHHHGSTNQAFRGLYGAIVVTEDVLENDLINVQQKIPDAAHTVALVLSDVTVCKMAPNNDAATYNASLPWAGPGGVLPVQSDPTPKLLCEFPIDDLGAEVNTSMSVPLNPGDIPNIQLNAASPPHYVNLRTNEGQTVLTNGVNVGGRAGSPASPQPLPASSLAYPSSGPPVASGDWLRLQLWNAATVRYFRLILTTEGGTQVDLYRIGGEGGLLDHPIKEGGTLGSGVVTKYDPGEILLPPGSRADVVAVIPTGQNNTALTLWTLDISRTGQGYSNIPTVPVMHIRAGADITPKFIDETVQLRTGTLVEDLRTAAAVTVQDPASFSFPPTNAVTTAIQKMGSSDPVIHLTQSGGHPGIDGMAGSHDIAPPYTDSDYMMTARYAKIGDVLELTIQNQTTADHPFHMHGFSMQPISLTDGVNLYQWAQDYREFRDNINVLAGYTLTVRVKLEPRNLVDDVTPGGAIGRWMFHCHIFFHAHLGMVSELVVTADDDGNMKPNVDVHGSWAGADLNLPATRTGTFAHRDGRQVELTASVGTIVAPPPGLNTPPGAGWSWQHQSASSFTDYVYITATDSLNPALKDQTVFRLRIDPMDDGADNGDTHIHTIDGKRYDFQAVGEFTLLQDDDGMEIQGRQTPVPAANPVTDSYSGLRSCVTVNTAVAASVGEHRISYQPGRERGELQLFIDGRPAEFPRRGLDLGEHRLTVEDVTGGGTAVRVDYANGTILTITPYLWTPYSVWLLNVSVARTQGDAGLMGPIPANSWLPVLRNGSTVGPMPASLSDRWAQLYGIFAESWRITNGRSLFVYYGKTSTETFTDRDWPAEGKSACQVKPQFELPGMPVLQGMPLEQAERVCRRIKDGRLHADCVFDVATTGEEVFALGAQLAQEHRQRATAVQVIGDKHYSAVGEVVKVTAIVSNVFRGAPMPRGKVAFFVDDVQAGAAVSLDGSGRATKELSGLTPGDHRIRADYDGSKAGCWALLWLLLFRRRRARGFSSSPNLVHVVIA